MDLTLMDTAYAYDSIMHYTGFEFSIVSSETFGEYIFRMANQLLFQGCPFEIWEEESS